MREIFKISGCSDINTVGSLLALQSLCTVFSLYLFDLAEDVREFVGLFECAQIDSTPFKECDKLTVDTSEFTKEYS